VSSTGQLIQDQFLKIHRRSRSELTRFNPTSPFTPAGDLTAFFGSPAYNNTFADVQTGMAVVDHDFGNGLTVKNSSLYADYNRAYQNVYPGSSVANGMFTMIMFVSFDQGETTIAALKEALEATGARIGPQIHVQHENIFKFMHRI